MSRKMAYESTLNLTTLFLFLSSSFSFIFLFITSLLFSLSPPKLDPWFQSSLSFFLLLNWIYYHSHHLVCMSQKQRKIQITIAILIIDLTYGRQISNSNAISHSKIYMPYKEIATNYLITIFFNISHILLICMFSHSPKITQNFLFLTNVLACFLEMGVALIL